MILGFLFFIQTFLKLCKALRTEKYKRYINILFIYLFIVDITWRLDLIFLITKGGVTSYEHNITPGGKSIRKQVSHLFLLQQPTSVVSFWLRIKFNHFGTLTVYLSDTLYFQKS